MDIQDYNKIRRVALGLGFKRNTTDMWFKRKSIPHEVQIKIFEASNGAISFPHMASLSGKRPIYPLDIPPKPNQ